MQPRPTPYRTYGTAIYRRELRVELGPGRALGELIDDFHHFRAEISHDGAHVTSIVGSAPRYPWSTCVDARLPLQRLVGMPLARSLRGTGAYTDARAQCTHMFDAASLAIARLGRRAGPVVYQIAVPDRVDGRTRPSLRRDAEPVLSWELAGDRIEGPAPYGPRPLRGLADWAETELDEDLAEAVMLLQRACVISGGRMLDLERYPRAADVQPNPMGRCHTYSPGVVDGALRMAGSARDMTAARDLREVSLSPSAAAGSD